LSLKTDHQVKLDPNQRNTCKLKKGVDSIYQFPLNFRTDKLHFRLPNVWATFPWWRRWRWSRRRRWQRRRRQPSRKSTKSTRRSQCRRPSCRIPRTKEVSGTLLYLCYLIVVITVFGQFESRWQFHQHFTSGWLFCTTVFYSAFI